jgi:hypothetical protein
MLILIRVPAVTVLYDVVYRYKIILSNDTDIISSLREGPKDSDTQRVERLEIQTLQVTSSRFPAPTTISSTVRPRRTASRDSTTDSDTTIMSSFESLKREAVHLERQLEDKIARFQQVRFVS